MEIPLRRETNIALVPQLTPLLRNAQEIKRLAPLQRRLGVNLPIRQLRRLVHEELGRPHPGAVPLGEGRGQPRRDAQDADDEEDGDGERVVQEALGELRLGDEAELEVVAGEAVDAVDEVVQRGEAVPFVAGLGGGGSEDGRVEDLAADFGGVAPGGLF